MEIEIIRRIETIQKQLRDLMAQESEGDSGGATIASQIEVDAGVDNAKIVTPLTLANATSILQGINAGDGIASDGSSSPTISLDINGLTAESSADNADLIAIYDDSANDLRNMSRTNFLSSIGGWPFNNIKTVSAAAGATYASIVAAITGMTAGDIILVDAGTWTSSLTMSKAGAFIALNPEKTTITTSTTDDSINVTADNVIIDGFTITNSKTGADRACITSGNDNLIVKNCLITKTGAATNSYGIRNTGGVDWKIEDVTVAVSGGTNNYAFKADTAASETAIGGGSYTGVEGHIYVGHISADIIIQGEPLINGVVASDVILTNNASGLTANFGDIGLLDKAGDYDDTATEADNVAWCIALTDSIANAQILVKRRGNAIVSYTGTAPSAGHFLVTSTTAGDALRSTTMHPAIFSVCTANGAGGIVAVMLLTGTATQMLTNSNDVLRINTLSNTDFVATINGAPVGAAVVYNAPSSGHENTIEPSASTQVGKIVLHNTTKGDSALISLTNVGTNTITLTAAAPGAWANGDTITARSQTATGTLGASDYLYDLDLSSFLPELVRSAFFYFSHVDSSPSSSRFHYIQNNNQVATPAVGDFMQATSATISVSKISPIDVFDKQIAFAVNASGVGTSTIITRIRAVNIAIP